MNIDKNLLIEHIKDAEQLLVMRKVIDKLERVVSNHSVEYTDFLDPYQRKLCHSFLNKFHEVCYFEEGGLESAERKSIVIYPAYLEKNSIELPIIALRIDGSFKFRELNHRDYLGALMSLGIKREKIGDILIHKEYGNIVVLQEIAPYIKYNLEMINKEPITITEINTSQLIEVEEEYIEKNIIVPSFRLDAFVSAICNLSRDKSSSLVRNGYVKVNWQTIDTISKEVCEGDLLSIRGFGRTKIIGNLGKTKKDRIKVIVKIIM
ncbi:RNA-binding protein YlmH, contains S4-like domain [Proteiniborus ethanoligenes]|uniref:RNA-binding protein YlmH, contains S4-like domain n=1 Tax=Proteiniborus ethanoligenes TaxID=415015 RepID=A0A1H3QTD6_9FIRM|nr:YlmH/Sll1252 family protein [Proteiniborus ethanoligenes]SDZ16697.1 RNA-binding protein YlmH, contains S4-like domain [Proteiniborus ethanoligenes]